MGGKGDKDIKILLDKIEALSEHNLTSTYKVKEANSQQHKKRFICNVTNIYKNNLSSSVQTTRKW